MRYVFHPEALSEYAEAVQHYADQRAEIAQVFINAIEDAVYWIRESPKRYVVIDENVRRCMIRKFLSEFSTYTIEPDYILILAVMHCSREAGY
jgi:toxin ParE1/3/4